MRKISVCLSTCIVFLSASLLSFAGINPYAPSGGKVFEKNSNQTKLLFHWNREESGDENNLNITSRYLDLKGEIAVQEDVTIKNRQLNKYIITQNQIKELQTLDVLSDKIVFRKKQIETGKEKISEEKLPENLTIGPTIVHLIRQNWGKLLKDEKVKIRFAVLSRSETVGFSLSKNDIKDLGDKINLVVKMKPTNFLISTLVDPVYLTLELNKGEDASHARLIELLGRTLLKEYIKNSWKDLDANILYRYQ